jgi:hypothetical protein
VLACVAVHSPRALASFDCALTTRSTTMASTSSRETECLPSRSSSPKARTVPSTAATCPWGTLRSILKASAKGCALARDSGCPRSSARSASMRSAGQCDRLARVRFFTRPPSR